MTYGISDQTKAARHRMDDAKALLKERRWRGSMYLAGYAVECTLKTKLMRTFDCRQLEELEEKLRKRRLLPARATVFTHQLEILLRLTTGLDRLRQNRELWHAFNLTNRWVPAWRYSADLSNSTDAQAFIQAVDRLLHWIEHNA